VAINLLQALSAQAAYLNENGEKRKIYFKNSTQVNFFVLIILQLRPFIFGFSSFFNGFGDNFF
jgi:hypothetical protein